MVFAIRILVFKRNLHTVQCMEMEHALSASCAMDYTATNGNVSSLLWYDNSLDEIATLYVNGRQWTIIQTQVPLWTSHTDYTCNTEQNIIMIAYIYQSCSYTGMSPQDAAV